MLQEVFPRQWCTLQRWPMLQYHMSGMSLVFLQHNIWICTLNLDVYLLCLFLPVVSTRLQLPLRRERLWYHRDLLWGLWTGVLELHSFVCFLVSNCSFFACWEWWAWVKKEVLCLWLFLFFSALPTSINKMVTSARWTRYVDDDIWEDSIDPNRICYAADWEYILSSLKGRCYNGECKTRESQCKYIWGQSKTPFSRELVLVECHSIIQRYCMKIDFLL